MTRMSQSNSKSRAAGAGFAFPVSPERPPAEFCSEPWTGGRLCAAVSDEGALRMRHTPCGCTSARLSGIHQTSSIVVTPQLCLRRPTFSVLPEKVGKKMRRGRAILRAHARDFYLRPLRAQDCDRSDGFRFRQMYYTHLRVDCDNFGSAHFRNTRPILFMYCTLFVFHTRL